MRSTLLLAWFLASTVPARAAAAAWTAMSGLPGAEIQTIAFDPAAVGIALAGAAGGQIFRSTDGGATWSRKPLGRPATQINAIAFAPSTPGLVYAATSCPSACNRAVYVSTDHGVSWVPTAAQPNVFPSISGNALLVTSSGNLLALVGNNLALSKDGGQSWQYPLIQNKQQIYGFSGLSITGAGASTLWAAGFDASLTNETFSSADGGQTWTPHAISGLPASTYTGSVAVNPAGNAIFVTYSNGVNIAGLAASTDGGNTFLPVTHGLPSELVPASTPNWMAFDPQTPSHVVLGTASQGGRTALAESNDGGFTWSPTGARIPGELAASVVAFRPANAAFGQALFAGADALFAGASSDAPLADSSQGLDRGSLRLVAEDGASKTGLLAVTPTGVYHSADSGHVWHGASGWKGTHYVVQPARQLVGNGALYVLTGENRVFRTSDQGALWTEVTPPYASHATIVGGVYADATKSGTIYVATYSKDFYVSNDSGTTWTRVVLARARLSWARSPVTMSVRRSRNRSWLRTSAAMTSIFRYALQYL